MRRVIRVIDNGLNSVFNLIKRYLICSWKGHDYTKPYCFRCWLYCPEMWEE